MPEELSGTRMTGFIPQLNLLAPATLTWLQPCQSPAQTTVQLSNSFPHGLLACPVLLSLILFQEPK